MPPQELNFAGVESMSEWAQWYWGLLVNEGTSATWRDVR
jgi:hypothetical protein